jgi:ribose transport system permease protein
MWPLFVTMLVIYFALEPDGLRITQLSLTIQTTLPLVLVSVAQCFVLLTGGIDVSVGGVMALTDVLMATWLRGGNEWHIVLIVIIGLGAGVLNGCLVVVAKIPPFIATIATWSIYDGIALYILGSPGGSPPASFTTWVTGTAGPFPMPILLLVALLLLAWYSRNTELLKRIISIGSDKERAHLSGVRVERTQFAAYAIAGLFAALAGIYLALITATGDPTVGDGYVLQSVEAAVIGGVSLAGGVGGMGMAVAGSFMLTCCYNIISELSIPSWVAPPILGVLLLTVIGLRSRLERRELEHREIR